MPWLKQLSDHATDILNVNSIYYNNLNITIVELVLNLDVNVNHLRSFKIICKKQTKYNEEMILQTYTS